MSEHSTNGAALLDQVREWLARYIGVVREDDLDILALWAAHTWFAEVTYTTPRLFITSPIHGSGKTTALEHMERLTKAPVQMSNVSSPALLTRMLGEGMRTVLIDEVDRSLNPKLDGVGEIIAVLNSGYKTGATRPTLVPNKDNGWIAKELPTYSPVAMAGNSPNLPDDTLSRCIPIHLVPSDDVEESDWEAIDHDGRALGLRLRSWAESAMDLARQSPPLPEPVKGRGKERWRPLKRVAVAAGGRWPAVVDHLALEDVQRIETEKEDGLIQERPHIILLRHLAEVWPNGQPFAESKVLLDRLHFEYPDVWGTESTFDKPLTHQRMGRMLSKNFGLQTARPDTQGPRGYMLSKLKPLFIRMNVTPPGEPDKPAEPAEPDTDVIHLSGKATLSSSPDRGNGTGSVCPNHGTELKPGVCYTCSEMTGVRWGSR